MMNTLLFIPTIFIALNPDFLFQLYMNRAIRVSNYASQHHGSSTIILNSHHQVNNRLLTSQTTPLSDFKRIPFYFYLSPSDMTQGQRKENYA